MGFFFLFYSFSSSSLFCSCGFSDIISDIFPVFMSQAWAFNLLDDGGDETARALGVNVKRTRLLCGGAVTLLTASVVSFTGIIGFVGLVAPHMARMLIGGDYRHLPTG